MPCRHLAVSKTILCVSKLEHYRLVRNNITTIHFMVVHHIPKMHGDSSLSRVIKKKKCMWHMLVVSRCHQACTRPGADGCLCFFWVSQNWCLTHIITIPVRCLPISVPENSSFLGRMHSYLSRSKT